MVPDIDLMPVVQPSPLEVFIIHPETKGVNQMQHQFGRSAQAGNIPRIGRDFGLIEDHMEEGIIKGPMFDPGDRTCHGNIEPVYRIFICPDGTFQDSPTNGSLVAEQQNLSRMKLLLYLTFRILFCPWLG